MKVYKFEIIVVDFDELGSQEISEIFENTHYPNYCIFPRVLRVSQRDIDWTDNNPLNYTEEWKNAANQLFQKD